MKQNTTAFTALIPCEVRIPTEVRITSWGGHRFGEQPKDKVIKILPWMEAMPWDDMEKSPKRVEREADLELAWENILSGKSPMDSITCDIMRLAERSASFEFRLDGYSKAGLGEVRFGDAVLREDSSPIRPWYKNTTVNVLAEDVGCMWTEAYPFQCVCRNDTQQVLWHTCKGESIRTKDEFLQYVQRRKDEAALRKRQDSYFEEEMSGVLAQLSALKDNPDIGAHNICKVETIIQNLSKLPTG